MTFSLQFADDCGKMNSRRGNSFKQATKYPGRLAKLIIQNLTPQGVFGLQFGHVAKKLIIPVGAHADLDATGGPCHH
jgi:muramoyltetrapeptide carboxypeptidase LdcA involved in peptidoglycan recycling